MNMSRLFTTLALLVGSLSSLLAVEPVITVNILNIPGNIPIPLRMSNDYKTVVGEVDQNAFSYSMETGIATIWGLGTMWAANNDGKLCGELQNPATLATEAGYTTGSTFNYIGNVVPHVPTGELYSTAYDMTPDGNTIIGFSWIATMTTQACVWNGTQAPVGLPTAANQSSSAKAVSDDGSVIVGWETSTAIPRLATYWKNGVKSVIPGWGELTSVSADGNTMAGALNGELGEYSITGGLKLHGKLEGDGWAAGLSVSDSGIIAGISALGNIRKAVVWSQNTGLKKLGDYLTSLVPNTTNPAHTGWEFMQLNYISPDGKHFLGFGKAPGVPGVKAYHVNVDYGSDIEQNNSLPADCKITGNYPNPFNPSTSVTFELNRQSDMKIQFINSQGQLVKETILGKLASGSHQYKFNGEQFNSGIYFCNLIENGKIAASHKMVLTK